MRRRPFLHLAAGTLAAAGSIGAADSRPRRSDASPADSGTATRMAAADRAASVAVERVETPTYVVRLNDLGHDPDGRITRFSGLSERERAVVTTALSGTHRTRDPPEWLVRFASATPMVTRDGRYYSLEHTFPTYAVTAEAVSAGDVDGRIASYREYEAAVTRDGYVLSSLLRAARRESVELSYVWPALREFFETFEAVRYHGDVVDFSVAVEDDGPPYELSGDRVPVSTVAAGPVWNADDASDRARALVRRAGRTRGAYGFERAPAGLLDRLAANEFVHLGGTFYAASVEKRGRAPVSVSADVSEGRLRLGLRNDGDADLRLSAGPPRPFGVVRCRPTDTDAAAGHLLWTDAYAASDRVRTAGREVRGTDDVTPTSTVRPGETVSERYAVPADLPPGEYVVEDSLGVEFGDETESDDSSTVRYRVAFSVT